jgi:phosphate transport system permease protein
MPDKKKSETSQKESKHLADQTQIDSHFQRKVDRANRLARYIITFGGYGIIISIVGILLFLLYQSMPLSFKASLKKTFSFEIPAPKSRILLTGVDQYREISYSLNDRGVIDFYNLKSKSIIQKDSLPLKPQERILSASKGSLSKELFAVGTDQGRILSAEIKMQPQYQGNIRLIQPSFAFTDSFTVEMEPDSQFNHIEKISYCENEDGIQYWAWVNHQGKLYLKIYDPDDEENYFYDLTPNLGSEIFSTFTTSYDGRMLIVGSQSGELFWFNMRDIQQVSLNDNWKASATVITALEFLIGDNSLVVGDGKGSVEVWFPVRDEENELKFRPVHNFEPLPEAATQIYSSPRNRSFLAIDEIGNIHLDYSTTSQTQLEFRKSDFPVQTAAFAPKSNGIIIIDIKDRYGFYFLKDEHPEATLQSLFGKVWYEGYPKPEFVWQSTGGSDEFESKLSLIPLIFGTLKGTIYAMLFSVPLAILAAIYVAQFAPKRFARIIKPTVEIMAALPSVVIGFLAGLYFSPLFENHLMLIFLFIFFLPLVFLVGVVLWRLVPEKKRMLVPVGWELLFVIPLILTTFFLASSFSHSVEFSLFGGSVKQWLLDVLGQTYDQRNSMVVGFALGFAVIPIIFTISEDALSNVPDSLTSASLALGASRWQTVRRVVLPAAAGGIFAAVMLGFGRAIGETMIVLMATGNTPIMDLSPFNGFRAMSACIAVEIPEAPVGGTLYRVLFLVALLLFVFTFVINSLSALIGDRLRKKYARF